MEPLETPVKDGILYQQHIKFGKVRTLAARQLPGTVGLCPSLGQPTQTWQKGDGSQGRGMEPRGGGGQSFVLSLSRWADPEGLLVRPYLIYRWDSQEPGGSKTQTSGQGRARRLTNPTTFHPSKGRGLSWGRPQRWSPTLQKSAWLFPACHET